MKMICNEYAQVHNFQSNSLFLLVLPLPIFLCPVVPLTVNRNNIYIIQIGIRNHRSNVSVCICQNNIEIYINLL